jgi:hypothetical protein
VKAISSRMLLRAEVLKRFRIVREIKALIRELRENQLDHEGFETEPLPFELHPARPVFDEAGDLRKIRLMRLLALADEFEVAGDAGFEE